MMSAIIQLLVGLFLGRLIFKVIDDVFSIEMVIVALIVLFVIGALLYDAGIPILEWIDILI